MPAELEIVNQEPTWNSLVLVPITDEDHAALVSDHLNAIKRYEDRVELFFRGTEEKPAALVLAYRAYQDQLAKEKIALEPAKADRAKCKELLLAWDDVQTAKAAEEQRVRDEVARQEAETRQIEEAAEVERMAASASSPEEEVALREEAEVILTTPVTTVAAQVVKPKVAGASVGGKWKCRRDKVNVKVLAAAVGAGRADVTYVEANFTALDARAHSSKGTAKVPGVEFYLDRTVSATAGRGRK